MNVRRVRQTGLTGSLLVVGLLALGCTSSDDGGADSDCAGVDCGDTTCPAGKHAEAVDGECCTVCVADEDPCEGVVCDDVVCESGTHPAVVDGCCPTCVGDNNNVDCSEVDCISQACTYGRLETPAGECCPVCVDEQCPPCRPVICPEGTSAIGDECCTDDCESDTCAGTMCGDSYEEFCPMGQVMTVPEGGCCPSCLPEFGCAADFETAFDRTCTTDEDCAIGLHQSDCCGTVRAMGISTSAEDRFASMESVCAPTWPECDCMTRGTITDDDESFTGLGEIVVACDATAGLCSTFIQ